MISVSKLLYLMLVAGILFVALKTYYFQNNLEMIITEEVYGLESKIGFIGNLLVSIVSVLSFVLYRKHFPTYVSVCYIALIICVFKASYNDLEELSNSPNFFYSLKGMGNYVNIGLVFFAAARVHFDRLMKLFYYISFAFIIAGLINLSKLDPGSGRTQYLYAVREFTVYLMWVFPFFLLQDEKNKTKNLINFIAYLLILVFVLSTGSRSYLFIYGVYFVVKFNEQFRRNNSILVISGLAGMMVLAFLVMSGSGLEKTVDVALDNLRERTWDDTRTSQLEEFWQQYSFDNIVEGVGPKATWSWSATGPYASLDNQFLLISWWAGLPTILVYVYFLVRTFFQQSHLVLFRNIKGTRLVIMWWILACMGFAIYVNVSSSLYYYFITLLMGLQVCRSTMTETAADVEEN